MPTRPRRRTPRPKARRASAAPRLPSERAPGLPSAEAPRPLLAERPHAHIVCRSCGRIAPLALDTEEELRLERLARAAPEGWSVDLVAFSLTGACARCRQGPAAPE